MTKIAKVEKNLFIEQLRGIAVILVVLYHYTNRIPHSFMGSEHPPYLEFLYGKIGVYLFFIISGLLIAKTLEKSSSLGDFYAMRVSRIWPLFIVACITTFIWAHCFDTPIVPEGVNDFNVKERTFFDLIGNILFLEDLGFDWIDGAYWSILVELKYYAIIGFFAFAFKDRYIEAFAWFAIILGIFDILFLLINAFESHIIVNKILYGLFVANYLPFFAIGMMIYKHKYNILFVVCVLLSVIQLLQAVSNNPDFKILETLKFLTVFSVFLIFDYLVVRGKISAFIGKYSYSIYLFHQVIGLSLIMMMTPIIGINYAIIIALVFVLVLSVFASWLVEWRFRNVAYDLIYNTGSLIRLDKFKLALTVRTVL